MAEKDRQLDNILEQCLERLLVRGETIEECLASYRQQAEALKPLLQTAAAAKRIRTLEPSPEFRAKARYQFRSALQAAASRKSRPFFIWRFKWATAVAVVLVLLLASGGVLAAASNSMPDEPLYNVKLAVEQLQIRLTPSALGKAKLYARLADRRVAEIIRMAEKGNATLAEVVTQRLDNQLTMIASLAVIHRQESGVFDKALPPLAPELESQALAPEMETTDGQAFPTQDDNRDKLVILLQQYAISHPAALGNMLAAAPEELRPVLLQAIAVALAGYENALSAIGE